MITWILSLMIALQPQAPWRETYETTAKAIAGVVNDQAPLFAGDDGREKSAALLVALSWAESRFDPKAVGDHGRSVGLYQIFGPNLPTPEGFGRTDILGNQVNATKVAHRMLKQSMSLCGKYPVEERLGWYAAGTCDKGHSESRFRVGLAFKIFKAHPPKDTKEPVAVVAAQEPTKRED
jgi:Transglycosylase SLT domain